MRSRCAGVNVWHSNSYGATGKINYKLAPFEDHDVTEALKAMGRCARWRDDGDSSDSAWLVDPNQNARALIKAVEKTTSVFEVQGMVECHPPPGGSLASYDAGISLKKNYSPRGGTGEDM